MKRILAVILAVFVLLTAGAVGVFAARGNKETGFTDENNNGICDNPGENVAFADADGDGICDNKEANNCLNGMGIGAGKGNKHRENKHN